NFAAPAQDCLRAAWTRRCLLWVATVHVPCSTHVRQGPQADSVADAITPFDNHEGAGEQSDQLFLSTVNREHVGLGQSESAASFHHAPTSNDTLACGGSKKVALKLGGENPGVSRHESKRCISRRAIGDGAHSPAMDETVLLRDFWMGK